MDSLPDSIEGVLEWPPSVGDIAISRLDFCLDRRGVFGGDACSRTWDLIGIELVLTEGDARPPFILGVSLV